MCTCAYCKFSSRHIRTIRDRINNKFTKGNIKLEGYRSVSTDVERKRKMKTKLKYLSLP